MSFDPRMALASSLRLFKVIFSLILRNVHSSIGSVVASVPQSDAATRRNQSQMTGTAWATPAFNYKTSSPVRRQTLPPVKWRARPGLRLLLKIVY